VTPSQAPPAACGLGPGEALGRAAWLLAGPASAAVQPGLGLLGLGRHNSMQHRFAILGILMAGVAYGSEPWNPSTVPNPMKDPSACGRENVPKSAICDPDNLLSESGKNIVEGLMNGIHNVAQVAVLFIGKMDTGFSKEESVEAASKRFAKSVRKSWGVGDRGILVFISAEDRSILICKGP